MMTLTHRNQKQVWISRLQEWQQAVTERDSQFASLQQELQECQVRPTDEELQQQLIECKRDYERLREKTVSAFPEAQPTPTPSPNIAQPAPTPGTQAVTSTLNPIVTPVRKPAISPAPKREEAKYSCSPRKTCKQMSSCEEAQYHLNVCGNKGLDRDKDGIPCETICPGG
jgi:hypothetical protein